MNMQTLSIYFRPHFLKMLLLGFSSGLPLTLILGTLGIWLREAGMSLSTIAFFSWVGLIYGLKMFWAPFIDSVRLGWLADRLGHRRSWLLVTQLGIIAGLLLIAFINPRSAFGLFVGVVLATAFLSATQDIALDAYRIESVPLEEQAALTAMYSMGYRIAIIWGNAGALLLAGFLSYGTGYDGHAWSLTYAVMALSLTTGVVATLLVREDAANGPVDRAKSGYSQWFAKTFLDPFVDFVRRYGSQTLLILIFIATYRMSDVVMGSIANVFYVDMHFTKEEIAAASKIFGVAMTILGTFVGGVLTTRYGIVRILLLGAVLTSATNVLFSVLSLLGHSMLFLVFSICLDNIASGIAAVTFTAYLSGLTSRAYTAAQYALLSSVMILVPRFLGGFSGWVIEHTGYFSFFIGTALIGIPVVFVILYLYRNDLRKSP